MEKKNLSNFIISVHSTCHMSETANQPVVLRTSLDEAPAHGGKTTFSAFGYSVITFLHICVPCGTKIKGK